MVTHARSQTPASSPDPMWLADTPPVSAPPAWRPSVTRPPVLQAPARLVGKIGEAFATTLASLQDRLRDPEPHEFEAAMADLARLENLGLQVQQMARVMGHQGAGEPEGLDLTAAVGQALAQWQGAASARGVVLSQPDDATAVVQVDPALFEQLFDLTLEHALEAGDSVAVRVRPQPLSRQALLLIDVQRSGPITSAAAAEKPDDGDDDLRWLMVQQIARAGGIGARRERTGSMHSVGLTFPLATLGAWFDTAPGQS